MLALKRLFLVLGVLMLVVGLPAYAACIPVTIESPRPLPADNTETQAGCISYQSAPATLQGASGQVLVFGDPQVKNKQDVDYFQHDIVQPLRGHTAVLGISLGDLVDDVPSLYPDLLAVFSALNVPWLHALGNHDVDRDAESDMHARSAFHQQVGPSTFARETALANFVVLDDVIVQPQQRPGYVGGLREDQFAFLEHWLPTLNPQHLLVLAMHIPLFERSSADSFRAEDRARLYALLKPFPHVLVLSAHTHTQQHVFHDAAMGWQGETPLHEYNVGAACGAFWSGVKDAQGIPDSRMADGTPNGYAQLTVHAMGRYAVTWHNARDPSDSTMGLHAPAVLRRGAYPAWGVYANVYMGDDATQVAFRVDGGDWVAMKKVLAADPDLLAENARDDAAKTLRGYDRSPEAKPSAHLWRGALPTHLDAGEHWVEVRALDRWRGEVRAQTSYRLEDATP